MYKLEKKFKLYRAQLEKLSLSVFGDYRMQRTMNDIDRWRFYHRYQITHETAVPYYAHEWQEADYLGLDLTHYWCKLILVIITEIIGKDRAVTTDDVVDVFVPRWGWNQDTASVEIGVVSKNKEFLDWLDEQIPDGKVFDLYPNEYFRFYTDSYNDAMAKCYPELFTNKTTDIGVGNDNSVFVHTFTFQVLESCSLQCVAGDTPIRMFDLSTKPIKDIVPGDVVLGFDESLEPFSPLVPSRVTHVYEHFMGQKERLFRFKQNKYLNETYITGNHKLVTGKDNCYQWKRVDELDSHDKVYDSYGRELYWSREEVFEPIELYNLETETGTYIANDLRLHNCTYCYQFNKMPTRMPFSTAKLFIDHLLNDDYGYLNRYNSPAIILEFIGGEPLLEIKQIRRIYEYFLDQCYKKRHPWLTMHRLSICSNGMQYFDEEVQRFFHDYGEQISFNISIDGNKQLHDACRIQPNGEGSYDIDIAALHHYSTYYSKERNSKMTLAPNNIGYLYDSVVDFINQGMSVINLNCVFEEGWNVGTAKTEYEQLAKLGDYLLDNNLEHTYVAIFNENQEGPADRNMDSNFCFKGSECILSRNGYMPIERLREGDIVHNIGGQRYVVAKMHSYVSANNVVVRTNHAFDLHCTADHKIFAKRKSSGHAEFIEAGKLTPHDFIGLPVLPFPANEPAMFNDAMAYILGTFIANGSMFLDNEINQQTVVLNESTSIPMMQKAGLSFAYNHNTKMFHIYRDFSETNQYFYKLCADSGITTDKHFPSVVSTVAKHLVVSMVTGFVDAGKYRDGHIVKFPTVSKVLACEFASLLRCIGENPICYEENGLYWVEYYPATRLPVVEGCIWVPVLEVVKDANAYPVYCPTVAPLDGGEGDHTIVVNGVGAANCGGGSGSMLAMRPNGQFYPCIRFMPTSVGDGVPDMVMGDVQTGLIGRAENSDVLGVLDNVTRRSQTNDICYECQLSNNCPNCSALGVTLFGTPNKRTTFICIQRIAESLANVRYWNLMGIKHPEWHIKPRRIVVPDEWALLVIDREELTWLYKLETLAEMTYMENEW